MSQETPVLLTCEVGFRPKSESCRQRICSIVEQGSLLVSATVGWRFSEGRLLITGIGFDGRCSVCREVRRKAKAEGLLFSCRCSYERDDEFSWRVRVGKTSFDITLLENEAQYIRRKQESPQDVLVRTHLGVIAELRGELTTALAEYFAVLRLRPDDKFTQRRIHDVSMRLLAQKRAKATEAQVASS